MHVPAASWHSHHDHTLEVKAPTEFEAWAMFTQKVLAALAYNNPRLMLGYWLDALNTLPEDTRKTFIQGIARGLGLSIKPAEDESNAILIDLVQKYDPLAGDKKSKGGIVLPRGVSVGDLVLPGDPKFGVKAT
jgi:hypothetical protein